MLAQFVPMQAYIPTKATSIPTQTAAAGPDGAAPDRMKTIGSFLDVTMQVMKPMQQADRPASTVPIPDRGSTDQSHGVPTPD